MIIVKDKSAIEKMRYCGKIVVNALNEMSQNIKPGVTTDTLNDIGERVLEKFGASPSFKGYRGFPKAVCISVNEEVVHGIPGNRVLEEGDIVTLDIGAYHDGYHGDSAWTYPVGKISDDARRLLNVTRESLMQGIAQAKPGKSIGDISHAIQSYVERNSYSVVRDLVGHGIGENLHEEPSVPNFGKPGTGPRLKPGMTLCIEPMINQGRKDVVTLSDGWTVVAADGKLSAHFEHMVYITENGPEILTKLEDNVD